MNISYFQLLLQEAIDNSASTMDYLFLARALVSLNMGQIRSVSTFANLPSAASNEGLLVWVTADERLYWSTGSDWYQITVTNRSTIWTWGCNNEGQLGINTTTSRTSPVSVVGGFCDWCMISAGGCHSLAVKLNGTVWAWGCNGSGRLGDNSATNQSSPVSVVGGFCDWCAISAGGSHSLAVTAGGGAWAWGSNSVGQLGDNSATNRSSPVSVTGGITDWCEISAGTTHSLGVTSGGGAWAWGINLAGQLGDNTTTTSRRSPVSVVGGITDWCEISAGNTHSLAVSSGGGAWAWGSNANGRLGDNTTTSQRSPVSVAGLVAWCHISAGEAHSLAISTRGEAWSWGCGGDGRLGNSSTVDQSSPILVQGGFRNWCMISAGEAHSLALTTVGVTWAWGCNGQGRLGDLTLTDRSSPTSVVGGFTDWCAVSAGGRHSMAIRADDFV